MAINLKRKNLTLPSGATCQIRALAAMDFLGSNASIPSTIIEGKFKDKQPEEAASLITEKELAWYGSLVRVSLLKACGAIVDSGRRFKIVDKPHYECGPGEITIEDLEQPDADMIFREVSELSNLGKGAAQAAGNFPEEARPNNGGASAG
jgi:hypothetical protein